MNFWTNEKIFWSRELNFWKDEFKFTGPEIYFYMLGFFCVLLLILLYYRYQIPKIIWSYWNDDTIPPFVKKIMDRRAAVLTGWEFRVLSDSTISKFLPASEFPPGYNTMRQSHKSDWLRLALLEKYGGCWLDATIIVNSADKFNEIYERFFLLNSFFCFFFTPFLIKIVPHPTFFYSCFFLEPL
jgi:hypothetical protein